jgi:hypothetical protein
MARRYLFGPVTRPFAEQNLYEEREAGDCVAFGLTDAPDLTIGLSDTWEDMVARLPSDWLPRFIVLYLPYERIPSFLWSAPAPVVALAADWNLLWHHFRRCLHRADLVLTDEAGVEVMAREGIGHARAANLYGCERAFLGAQPLGHLHHGRASPLHQGPDRRRRCLELSAGRGRQRHPGH